MQNFSDLRTKAQIYVSAVVLFGFATVLHSIATLYINPIGPEWLVLAALTLLTGSFTIKVPSITARLSVSETFVFASVLLFGPAAGTLTVVLETLIISLWVRREARSLYRALFNVAAPAASIWISATIFFAISGIKPYSNSDTPIAALFVPLAVLTTAYFLLNSWLVAIALGLERHRSAFEIWWKNFTWLAVNYFSGASVAAVIVTYTKRLDSSALISTLVIIVPLLVVSYLTFRTAMGRVEDSNQHLSELNRLYLSTIETLAMAIDAKDQITHGHIRRVQIYAVGLARRIGVTDDKLIKAIEAAALLHDMGKLAVPEYILNKPGRLTPAEFEKMKLHATVGADILSAIHFPYPVVPIVRHHHENWDGTGYPAGLKSTDIPIGARILAVVDCFDALTSDRPYRPRLSDQEALRILLDRRGSMYDPLIVDTFAAVHREIAPDPLGYSSTRHPLSDLIGSTQAITNGDDERRFDEIAASSEEMLTLYELARTVAQQTGFTDTTDVIAQHLKRLIPASLCVFYVFDPSSDDIEARHAVGDGASLVRGMRMNLGTRLSGWVAANRQTICNSDPVLDLGDAARPHALNLRSCLSTPLISGDALVGVLALYSGEVNAFTDNHKRVLEVASRQVADRLSRICDSHLANRGDTLATMPSIAQLDQIVRTATGESAAHSPRVALLLVEVLRIKPRNTNSDTREVDHSLRQIVQQMRTVLRAVDSMFRSDESSFVVFLSDADSLITDTITNRLRNSVRDNALVRESIVEIAVTSMPLPSTGTSLNDLIAVARVRNRTAESHTHPSVVH